MAELLPNANQFVSLLKMLLTDSEPNTNFGGETTAFVVVSGVPSTPPTSSCVCCITTLRQIRLFSGGFFQHSSVHFSTRWLWEWLGNERGVVKKSFSWATFASSNIFLNESATSCSLKRTAKMFYFSFSICKITCSPHPHSFGAFHILQVMSGVILWLAQSFNTWSLLIYYLNLLVFHNSIKSLYRRYLFLSTDQHLYHTCRVWLCDFKNDLFIFLPTWTPRLDQAKGQQARSAVRLSPLPEWHQSLRLCHWDPTLIQFARGLGRAPEQTWNWS